MAIKRVFLIIMDSFGIGAEPDAADFGDEGTNTIASCASSAKFSCPNLARLGLFHIDGVDCGSPAYHTLEPAGSYARLRERSAGKDTIIGHWELAGLISEKPMPTFPDGFPQAFLERFEQAVGRKCIVNRPYSGTKVIRDYGMEHLQAGALIVYTSADSVFQIAANEAVVPLEELYRDCEIARRMLTGDLAVGRVIARPFTGNSPDTFKRTSERHDYALSPFAPTMLDILKAAGKDVIGVGKIGDIFNMQGLTESTHTTGNADGCRLTKSIQERTDWSGLCFVNLVDFDMLYGHRRDIDGYAQAVADFDSWLTGFLADMREDDLLLISADHGCDPAFQKTTDHTREYVPLLLYGKQVKSIDLGTRNGFVHAAGTVCSALGIDSAFREDSLWEEIRR
jgi:phosphopentomutase